MYFIFRSKYDYLFSLNFSCPFPYFSRALCHLKSCPSNWFSFVLSWGYNFSWGVGGRGHLRVANKVFKPEPGKRKSFYFAIQFKSIFLRLQIRVKKKKMPEPHDIDHALQTSLHFQGFWPKNITWSWDQMAKRYLSLETCKTPKTHTSDLKEVYRCLICLLSAFLSLYHLFCSNN